MLVLFNARIYTPDPLPPAPTAIAIHGGRILDVGSDSQILGGADSNAKKVNLHGKTIWPGLIDAHIHLENFARSLERVDCETASQAECLQRIADRARTTPKGQWILGHGWNHNLWEEGYGNATMLDSVAADQPVYLTAKSLHAGWANSQALHLAGISPDTPDPQNGKIQRSESGELTGILFEGAMSLLERAIPEPTPEQVSKSIFNAQSVLWQFGLTGVHDFDQRRCFLALQILDERDKLRLRVVKSIPQENLPYAIGLGLRSGFGSEFLRTGSVKLFADGALGPRSAAMLKPYNDSENTGMLFLDAEQIVEIGQHAVQAGISMAIHAIGDRANHEVLDAYEQLRSFERQNGLPHLRHRIEHVQLLHPGDLTRLAHNQVIGSVQPIHATSDMNMADKFWGTRSAYGYAYRSLFNSGITMAFGSDAPVESPNPFWGLHAAVTRRRMDGQPGLDGWYPEQRISLTEALGAFTTGPAFVSGLENLQGQLSRGYFADLIVLDADPFNLPPQELFNICPSATMIGGEWVWGEAQL